MGLTWRKMTENKTRDGKSTEDDTAEGTPGDTATRGLLSSMFHRVGGRWEAEWPLVLSLSLELQYEAVLAGWPRRQRAALHSVPA